MNWMRFALTVIVTGFMASLTDWLFMGDLLYKRFNKYPEIWRYAGGSRGESQAVAWSAPLPFVTCAAFAVLCEWLHLHSISATFSLSLAVWLIAILPWMVTMALFVKLQPAIAASYSLGWLVKLSIAAAGVDLILR
jgi:hypothetical protein